ncbi:uncharacterized protein LOC141642613 [Silene latifolia]|uniref:uncharacterized protein LOC141642613 n=1 Tax=Silene latifolia TaxID=37657 RepID=UPI003D76FD86
MTGGTIISAKEGGGSGTKYEQIAPTSPLYLHPSDSPSLSLTQIKFDGENYELWADAVRNGLDAKNKLAFVEGTIEKPVTASGEDESNESVAWRQCNAMVKAWLRNVIEIRLHPSITFSGTVPEIWKELKEQFSTGNAPRVHQLKSELNDCKQGKDQSIVDYYTKLKSIWDELSTYSRVPQCTCGSAAALLKEREEEKVHQFLMGLDTSLYGNIRSNLLMEDDITSLSRAYSLMLREQRHRAVTKVKEEINEAAMAVKTTGGGVRGTVPDASHEQGEQPPLHCTFCNKDYHTEESCWEKHGYPSRGRGRGRRGGRGRGGRGRGNTFQVANAASTTNNDAQKQGQSALTSDEVVALRGLLGNKTEASHKLTGPVYEDADWTG